LGANRVSAGAFSFIPAYVSKRQSNSSYIPVNAAVSVAHNHFLFGLSVTNHSSTRRLSDPLFLYWLVAGLTGVWIVWDALIFELVTYSPHADYWEHTAVLTEWLRGIADPPNPHVLDSSSSPRYMPLFLVLTFAGQIFGLDAVDLMGISAVLSYALIVIGIRLFFRDYFNDDKAPLIAFIVLFCGWGVSWVWSNLYQLRSFLYVAGYPSSFVFGMSMIAFSLTLRVLREQVKLYAGAFCLMLLSALMFLIHPLTGVFGISGCGLLALVAWQDSYRNRAVIMAALFIGATVIAELWPWFSVWEVTLGRGGTDETSWMHGEGESGVLDRIRSGVWRHIFYDPLFVTVIIGFGLPSVVAWLWLLCRRSKRSPQDFIVLGGLVMLLPYFAHIFVSVPLAHRFLLFAIFYFHMAGVWALLHWLNAVKQERENGGIAAIFAGVFVTGWLAAAVIFNVAQAGLEFGGKSLYLRTMQFVNKFERFPDGGNTVDLYRSLTTGVGPYDVVMATDSSGWPLPTVTGKVVSLYHENPLLLDQFERKAAVELFYSEGATAEQRKDILARYSVSYVLVRDQEWVPGLSEWLGAVASETGRRGEYRMFKLQTR